jgi:acyl-CoA reductase-like NAD-dependent aldehyde dehydrogenase
MSNSMFPEKVQNFVNGKNVAPNDGRYFANLNPASGKMLCEVARSGSPDIQAAVQAALQAQPKWAATPPVQRGLKLHELVLGMRKEKEKIANIVAQETGKSFKDALGETAAAIELGLFYASEGQRLYGRTTTSGAANKHAMTIRQPVGVAGLIIAANTPIANVAWKIFPAMICGNAAILKPAEDTPVTAWIIGEIAIRCGLPPGVLNIVHGYGKEAGGPLVKHHDVGVISFTGSTAVGKEIAQITGARMAKASLELGGKNAFVICDDADLEAAVKWASLSAFSNAGQRCVAGSRIIVFDAVYDKFKELFVDHTRNLRIGPTDDDDLGPVINLRQLENMKAIVDRAQEKGARILVGGGRMDSDAHRDGFYMAPTIIEDADPHDEISTVELFGPITCLYRATDFDQALSLVNDSAYGLSACIHTRNFHRAITFVHQVNTGVAVVNGGTFGSEPHMPFGGTKNSGNGSREPGTEALDIYSELKDVYLNVFPDKL